MFEEKEAYRSNLQAIFRSVKDAIITVNEKLELLEVNEATRKICGFTRNDVGKEFGSLRKGCSENCLNALSQTLESKQPVEIPRLECRRITNPNQVVTITTSPLLNRQSSFSGVVLVVRDETRLADLERDLGERQQYHHIIGKSAKMQKIFSLIEVLSDVPTTVLITGESGTGKELVAEALHYSGVRSSAPLVKLNCSALSENLLESELFGHVKGAFTGAIKDKVGRFEIAQGGTILLDEIGDISPKMQLRLLRILQEKEFERVGDSASIKVDVRVIAATNQNLKEKVRRGEFREDLIYRIKVVEINMPPLRERRDDIPLLVNHILNKFNRKLNKKILDISDDVVKIFMNYSWPGNVRELEHALEHAFILCYLPVITANDLPSDFQGVISPEPLLSEGKRADDPQRIVQALEKTAWNKSEAARVLGISRRTIYRKIHEYNIMRQTVS